MRKHKSKNKVPTRGIYYQNPGTHDTRLGTVPVRKYSMYCRNRFSLHLVSQKHDYSLSLSIMLSPSLTLSLSLYVSMLRAMRARAQLFA